MLFRNQPRCPSTNTCLNQATGDYNSRLEYPCRGYKPRIYPRFVAYSGGQKFFEGSECNAMHVDTKFLISIFFWLLFFLLFWINNCNKCFWKNPNAMQCTSIRNFWSRYFLVFILFLFFLLFRINNCNKCFWKDPNAMHVDILLVIFYFVGCISSFFSFVLNK